MPFLRRLCFLAAGATSVLFGATVAPAQAQVLQPEWRVVMNDDTPRVTHNEFQGSAAESFPIEHLVLRKAIRFEGDRRDRVFVSLLRLQPNGEIHERAPYVSALAAPCGGWSTRLRFVVPPDGKSPPPAHPDYIPADRVLEHPTSMGLWFLSPDGTFGIANDIGSAVVFDVQELSIVQRLPGLAVDVSFAKSSTVFAAIIEVDGHKKNSHRLLLTLDRDRGVLHEKRVPNTVGEMYASNDGTYAILKAADTEHPTIANDDVVGVDLTTGQVAILLEDVGGNRYHSADGSRMIIVQGGWGKVLFFDTENIRHPRLLWTFETDGTLVSPAINDDGSRIAFMRSRSMGSPVTVEILDDSMEMVGRFSRPDEMPFALMFIGDYLFAGAQPGRGVHEWQTTSEIAVYLIP